MVSTDSGAGAGIRVRRASTKGSQFTILVAASLSAGFTRVRKSAPCAGRKVAKLDLFESCQLPSEERVLSAGSESMNWMIACASSSGNCPTTP
jgi:hypothetical protein